MGAANSLQLFFMIGAAYWWSLEPGVLGPIFFMPFIIHPYQSMGWATTTAILLLPAASFVTTFINTSTQRAFTIPALGLVTLCALRAQPSHVRHHGFIIAALFHAMGFMFDIYSLHYLAVAALATTWIERARYFVPLAWIALLPIFGMWTINSIELTVIVGQ